jgi:hypothetical protein
MNRVPPAPGGLPPPPKAVVTRATEGKASVVENPVAKAICRQADHLVPSAALHDAPVPWRSQSHSPAASEVVVNT